MKETLVGRYGLITLVNSLKENVNIKGEINVN